ncbi:hypothetical protein HKX48_000086 [Thoreauomyces humboldtii]|nr:hypothetical protein HKX48_000086 [Thoreauomyces humboldtii]
MAPPTIAASNTTSTKCPVVPLTPFVTTEYGSVASLLEFCLRLPKVDLHAHVNGSIPPEALRLLAERKLSAAGGETGKQAAQGALNVLDAITWKDEFDITDFFPLFRHIYALTNDPESLAFVARAVIEDFARDGVRYVELRSTPRDDPTTGLTKEIYVQTLVATLAASTTSQITPRLLLSIDRAKHSPEDASHVVSLALSEPSILGVDLCGDPHAGSFHAARPAVERAKAAGLAVTLHMGEVEGTDAESMGMLEVFPDRLGHATFMGSEVRKVVAERKLPIEMCMTSNVLSRTVDSYEVHHIREALESNHPAVLCTDDKGIISSPLSYEYALAASTFSLSRNDLFQLSRRAIEAAFCRKAEKEALRKVWDAWAAEEGLA